MIKKKRNIVLLALIAALIAILVVIIYIKPGVEAKVIYKSDSGIYPLSSGKNIVKFDETIYVPNLVEMYPDIEYVSYFDQNTNKTIAYINAFGGIGKNFLIYSDR